MLRGIGLCCDLGSADGAEIGIPFTAEGFDRAFVAAALVFAHSPAILVGNAGLEYHFLRDGLLIFFLGQVALIQHFTQDVQLTVAVTLRTVAFFPLVHIHAGGIGVEHRGVIGNADQAGAFCHRQILKLLAKVFRCRTFHTIAASAQVDAVQILRHNGILVVFPLKHLCPEDFHNLTLNRDALLIGHVFNKLLGDGRTTELGIPAKEHIHAGFDRGDPVHALVLIKTLVLNGNGSVDQCLGNFLQGRHLTVRGGIDLLKLLNIAAGIHIVYKGCFIHTVIVDRPVGSFRQNVILKIISQGSHKNHAAHQNDHQNRGRCTNGDLQKREGC